MKSEQNLNAVEQNFESTCTKCKKDCKMDLLSHLSSLLSRGPMGCLLSMLRRTDTLSRETTLSELHLEWTPYRRK